MAAGGFDAGVSGGTNPLLLAGGLNGWRRVRLALPADMTTVPDADLSWVSCASAGNCVAVGGYLDHSNRVQGLLAEERQGRWLTASEAPLPGDARGERALARGFADPVRSVSCASAGRCAAVGWYQDRSGHQNGLLLSGKHGRWSAAEASLPANAATNPEVQLNSVSCAGAGDCTAVGTYLDAFGHLHALLVSEVAGRWAPGVEARLPHDARPAQQTQNQILNVNSVSCASPGYCIAVGNYQDRTGAGQGLLLTQRRGRWKPGAEAPLPAGGTAAGELASVSCPSVGNCTGVGDFVSAESHYEGLLLIEARGQWTRGVEVNLPANAATQPVPQQHSDPLDPGSALLSVYCTSPGNCLAAGSYLDRDGGNRGLLVIQRGSSWTRGVDAHRATGRYPPAVTLRSVSCGTPHTCAAVGTGLLVGPG